MTCSCSAIFALLFTFLAVILTTTSFALPLWTRNTASFSLGIPPLFDAKANVQYSLGLWGLCIDSTTEQTVFTNENQVKQCIHYYSSSSLSTFVDDKFDTDLEEYNDYALCTYYADNTVIFEDIQNVVNVLGINVPSTFFEKTCGHLGKSTLVFGILSFVSGVFILLLLLFGMVCCKQSSKCVSMAALLAYGAGVLTATTWILWIIQSRTVRSSTASVLAVSFSLSVVAMCFYFLAGYLIFRHVRLGKEKEQASSQTVFTTVAPLVAVKATPLV